MELLEKIRYAPPEVQSRVEEYLDYLLSRVKNQSDEPLRQDWAGGLREFKDRYTSLELQKKALEWWSD